MDDAHQHWIDAERALRAQVLASTLRTDARFARAYALMGEAGLSWTQHAGGTITPDSWDAAAVRQRLGLDDDVPWLLWCVELDLHGKLHWCSRSGVGPGDDEMLGEDLEDLITVEGVLWLAARAR